MKLRWTRRCTLTLRDCGGEGLRVARMAHGAAAVRGCVCCVLAPGSDRLLQRLVKRRVLRV